MRLARKTAIVTGGGSGFGEGIVKKFFDEGAMVIVADIDHDAAKRVADLYDGMAFQMDVSKMEDWQALAQRVRDTFDGVDILVNNAGITRDALLLRMKEEDWDAVLSVNLKGAFLCSRAAAKLMSKQRSGRIINIASVVGQMGNAGQANYCASKAGLMGLTRSNARELAKRNVTVNAVAPGFIATAMTDALPEEKRQQLAAQIPLERLGSAEDIAHAVLFLASDQAGYITGQVLGVNGGMYM